MRANPRATCIQDRSGLARIAPALFQQRAVVPRRDEADLLRLGLVRGWQPQLRGHLPDLWLAQLTQREAGGRQLLLGEDPEEVGLVLVGVEGAQQAPAAIDAIDARVVAGRHLVGTVGGETATQELVELDVLV